MATKNLIPRGDGEGGIGKASVAWGSGVFKTGDFQEALIVEDGKETILGGPVLIKSNLTFSGDMLPATNSAFDIGSAEKKVRHLFLSPNSLYIGDHNIKGEGDKIVLSSGVQFGLDGATLESDEEGRLKTTTSGFLIGSAEFKSDPNDPSVLYFEKNPKTKDAEGNSTSILTADKMGLGTSSVLENVEEDLKFKLLTDEERFVIGTTGEGNLSSGWYRFNDFKVKGATDIGAHPINPVDTRIYSDESSFVLFKTDAAGNRVAHLIGGAEDVSPNNAIALGISVKIDEAEHPEDIEFVHTDGESYSVINGNSDSLGTNGLPIRQGFQAPSIGSAPPPLLIDGGSF